MKSLTLNAPAKINLYLDIINKRRDGYHNIETIFQKVSLSDTIKIGIIKKGISIYCRYPGIPANKANFCYKAAQLMQKKFSLDAGIEIDITKRIPPAAGLGGGSSDAACTITAINRLFNLGIATKRLLMIAREIGADVPFFVSGYSCAIGTGIGARLKEIRPSPLLDILILVPKLKLYTKTIYRKVMVRPRSSLTLNKAEGMSLSLTNSRRSVNMLTHFLSDYKRCSKIKRLLYNRLEEVVLPAYPIVKEAKEVLSSYNPAGVLLSGSGPAVFGIFNSRKEAMGAKQRLGRDGRWQLFLTRTI